MEDAAEIEPNSTGSPVSGEPVFLVVGQMGRPHGVRGEIQFKPLTDFPERLVPGKVILVGDAHAPYKLLGVRGSVKRMILALDGIFDRDQASYLRNELVYVLSTEVPELDEGVFYHHELIGLQAVSEDGTVLGILREIIDTPANEVFVLLQENGKELLIPAIDDVILAIDLVNETILVRLLPGL